MRSSKEGCGFVLFLSGIATLLMVGFGIAAWIQEIQFEQNCGGYLKRAADANNITRAADELNKAIAFMEKNDLTSGSSYIFYNTPECDIEFWYNNIKESRDELVEFPTDATPTDTSNQLIKLRETLIDHDGGDDGGDKVTLPPRIAFYPTHQAWFWSGVVCYTIGISALFILTVGIGIFVDKR